MQTGYKNAAIMGEWQIPRYHILMGSQIVRCLGATGSVVSEVVLKPCTDSWWCTDMTSLNICKRVPVCMHSDVHVHMLLWFCLWAQHINRRTESMETMWRAEVAGKGKSRRCRHYLMPSPLWYSSLCPVTLQSQHYPCEENCGAPPHLSFLYSIPQIPESLFSW